MSSAEKDPFRPETGDDVSVRGDKTMFRLRAPVLLLSVMLAGACGLQAASAFRFHHPRLKSVDIVPSEVVGGSATVVTGTVTLDEPAPTGGDVVTLSSSDTTSATVPASVTIAAGATSATFAVTTAQVSWESTVRIKAVLGDDHREDHVRVRPFEVKNFSFNPSSITGGTVFTGFQTTVGTVTISAPAGPDGLNVLLTSDHAGTSLSNTVTVPAGATSVDFSLVASSVTSKTVLHITASVGNSHKTARLTIVPST
jgi:hypothetical protein